MKKQIKSESEILRQKAEELLKNKSAKFVLQYTEAETQKLIHELEVHQIELEMQNEELIQAKLLSKEASVKYVELYDFAPSGYFTFSREGKIIELNLNGAKMLGKERSRLINIPFSMFVSGDTKSIFNLFLVNVFKTNEKKTCELNISANVDLPLYVYLTGIISVNGEQCIATMVDITDRKQTEALLNDIIEKNPLSIQIVDKEGYTLHGNPAYTRLFGAIPPPDFSIFDDLQHKSSELEQLIKRAKSGEVVHLPDLYFNPHDEVSEAPDIPLWIRALIFPLNDSGGKQKQFVLMHENITENKKAEQELIMAKDQAEQSDRLKSAFLCNMSHEIRTPMNGILGFAELLKEPGLTGEEQQNYIKIIEKSGARMLNIINDIVDISKIESGLMEVNMKASNINEQIEYIYTFFKPEVEGKGVQLSYRNGLISKESIIQTDREKLFAILTNLVKNAIKYTNKGSIEFGYNFVETHGRASLQFFVKDTGLGIPKDRQEAIFERFIQADISDKHALQGAGLGLSISKAYVEMLGGEIWIESEEGKGSVFYFTIPYNTESEEKIVIENIVPEDEAENHVKSLKILIAEDDGTSEMFIRMVVKMFSEEVLKAKTGVEAVDACRHNPDIDLILMDIQMPAMNGHEATRQIRQFNKDVIIIAQTAYALVGDRQKALEAGCNDYISKPISKDKLLTLIQKHFRNN